MKTLMAKFFYPVLIMVISTVGSENGLLAASKTGSFFFDEFDKTILELKKSTDSGDSVKLGLSPNKDKTLSNDSLPVPQSRSRADYIKDVFDYNTRYTTMGRSGSPIQWTQIGPKNFGGRTRSLMFDPINPNKVWAGSVSGGLFVNQDILDPNSSWQAVPGIQPQLAISCIVSGKYIQSQQPPLDMYIISTGEVYSGLDTLGYIGNTETGWNPTPLGVSSDGKLGQGFYVSLDNGANWEHIYINAKEFGTVTRLLISGDYLYIGTLHGLYVAQLSSFDLASKVFTTIYQVAQFTDMIISDLEKDKNGLVWLSCCKGKSTTSCVPGIYKLEYNANQTLQTLLPKYSLPVNVQDSKKIELAISPSNVNYIYAAVFNSPTTRRKKSGDLAFIIRSIDGGETQPWDERYLPYDPSSGNSTNSITNAQGHYSFAMAVHPTDPNKIFIGGVNLFFSADGGNEWLKISKKEVSSPGPEPYMHVDQHALVFKPGSSNTLLVSNDGGVYLIDNVNSIKPEFLFLPAVYPNIQPRNLGYITTQFYSCAIHPADDIVIGGTQDNGTIRIKEINTTNPLATEILGKDGGYCFIKKTNIATGPLQHHYVASTQYFDDCGIDETQNGNNFNILPININNREKLFITPFEYDPDKEIVFLPVYNNISNVGEVVAVSNTGIKIDTYQCPPAPERCPLPGKDFISAMYLFENIGGTTSIMIGTSTGRIFEGQLRGNPPTLKFVDWTGNAPIGYISSIEKNNETFILVYSSYGNKKYIDNSGAPTPLNLPKETHVWTLDYKNFGPWTDCTGNLPDIPVRWVISDPGDCNRAILATELGIYTTNDLTAATVDWQPSATGMGPVRVDMIRIRPSDRKMIAATHGRGMFTATLPLVITYPSSNNRQSSQQCCDPSSIYDLEGHIYNSSNTPIFQTNQFRSLEIDSRNNIWAGSTGSGAYFLSNCTWDTVQHFSGRNGFIVRSMKKNPNDSAIWIGMSKSSPCLGQVGGIYSYSTPTTFTRYLPPVSPPNNGLPSLVVRAIDFDKDDGKAWAGCTPQLCQPGYNGGLAVGINNNFISQAQGLPPDVNGTTFVTALTAGTDSVFVGVGRSCCTPSSLPYILARSVNQSSGAYTVYNNLTTPQVPVFSSTSTNAIRSLLLDSKGRLWIGGEMNGIAVKNPNGEWFYLESGLIPYPNGAIINFDAIYEDFRGIIYFGTSQGLLKYFGGDYLDPCSWSRFRIPAIAQQSINSIRVDNTDRLWLATNEGIFTQSEKRCFQAEVLSVIPANCNSNNAEVCIGASGGNQPYIGTGCFSELSPGAHTFEIVDAVGNDTLITVQIPQIPPLTVNATVIQNASCPGLSDAIVEVNVSGGVAPYFGTTGYFAGLSAGTYTYTVTDALSCTEDSTIVITEPPGIPLTATSIQTPILCSGTNTGSITVNASGGSPPYHGDLGFYDSLAAGFYRYVVFDSLNCPSETYQIIEQPDSILPNAGPDQAVCFSNVVSVTLEGNTPPANANGYWTVVQGSGIFFPDSTEVSPFVSNYSEGVNIYRWNFDCAGNTIHDDVLVYAHPLSSFDSLVITSSVNGTPFFNQLNLNICVGDSIQFQRTGGVRGLNGTYYWHANSCNNTQPGFDTNAVITVKPTTTTSYFLSIQSDCNVTTCLPFATVIVNPSSPEVCNAVDDNCNGQIDEGCGNNIFYRDLDGDGYGDPAVLQFTPTFTALPGYVANNLDCNDYNVSISPNSPEVPCNTIDDNCNGVIDEGAQFTFYLDLDGDGFGNVLNPIIACTPPAGYVALSTDCNDTLPSIYPGATETCNLLDDDCDSEVDEGTQLTFYRDFDGDGFGNSLNTLLACSAPAGYVNNSTDCNDSSLTSAPGLPEICNLLDDNCNGLIDEGVQLVFYRDQDGDGFGDVANITTACTPPSGFVSNSSDCNDGLNTVYPGASETCNLIDDDCDGQVDEGVQTSFFRDQDGDGYGNALVTTLACTVPAGYVGNNGDCNDGNSAVNPAANETCNLIDDDCDTIVDEGVQTTFYRDADGDGFGNPNVVQLACSQPLGHVSNNTDCNDARPATYPGAPELCNGVDDDCDGSIDEGVKTRFYRDQDQDGFGNLNVFLLSCTANIGYVADSSDCNDGESTVYPGANEICNGIDEDCDGQIDESCSGCAYLFSASTTSVTCGGYSNGTASVSPVVPGLNYAWSNGSTGSSISGLPAGTYTVSISNTAGCVDSIQVIVSEPPPLGVELTNLVPVSCPGGVNGSIISLVSGGIPPYNYQWSTGAVSPSLNNLFAGTYTLTVIDLSGCSAAATILLSQPPSITLNITSESVLCFGGSGGSLTSSVTGGTPPYSWLWSNGSTASAINGVIAGMYTLTVTDSSFCQVSDTASIMQPSALNAVLARTNVTCNGGSNGSVSVTVNGGVPPYTFNWSTGSTSATISALSIGTYTVTITDQNGCTTMKSTTVNQPQAISIVLTPTATSCSGGSNGTISSTVSGGTAPYAYAWSNGATTAQVGNLTAGTYTLTVTATGGCTKSASATIVQPAPLSVSTTVTNVSCQGGSNGAITANVTGGTTPYSYSWSNGSTVSSISGLQAGTYTVQVTSSGGCTASATGTVLQPASFSVSITASGPTVLCNGTSVTLSASSGSAYLWNTGATTSSITVGIAGSYTVTVTNASGCTGTATTSVTVSQGVVPAISITANPVGPVTASTSVLFTATATNGGSTPVYQWKKNGVNVGTNSSTYTNNTWLNGDTVQCFLTSNANCATPLTVPSNKIAVVVNSGGLPQFIVVDVTSNRACYYDSLFNFLSSSVMSTSVLNGITNAADVVATATAVFILDGVNKCVYRSTSAGVPAVRSRTLLTNTGATLTTPTGITLSGDTLWILDRGRSSIYRYSMAAAFNGSGNLNAVARIALAGGNSAGESVTNDAGFLYVLNNGNTKSVYRYLKSTGTSVKSRNLQSTTGTALNAATGLTFFNTRLWVADRGLDRVFAYPTGSLFSGNTALNASSFFPLNAVNLNATGIATIGTSGLLRFTEDVTISEPTDAVGDGLVLVPNPSDNIVTLHYKTSQPGPVLITINDMAGKTMLSRRETHEQAGPQSVELALRESGLIPGVYIITCTSESGKWSARLVLIW